MAAAITLCDPTESVRFDFLKQSGHPVLTLFHEMSDEVETVVIDNGSYTIKAGYAGDEAPRAVFPSVVGYPSSPARGTRGRKIDVYIGDEACAKAGILTLKSPIEHGVVTNWDDMEKLWHHTYDEELRIDSSEHPLIITEAPQNPKRNRERMAQIFFETFNVPSFYVVIPAIMDLISSGRTTGIVLDVGGGVTEIVPAYEGCLLTPAVRRMNFGGCDVNVWLQKILSQRGHAFTSSAELEIVRDIKEKLGYVAVNLETEFVKAATTRECDVSYTLSDGTDIVLAGERFCGPELLFKPSLNGLEFNGIAQVLFESITKCEIDIRKDLYGNIVLAGGTTMFTGFPERIEKEITRLASPKMKIRVVAVPERKFGAWVGGSIFGSLAIFPQSVITRKEYNSTGCGIVHTKCS
jgi:actin